MVVEIMLTSGWEMCESLQLVHRRGMVCIVNAQWEGTCFMSQQLLIVTLRAAMLWTYTHEFPSLGTGDIH